MVTALAALRQLWLDARCDPAALERVTLTGSDPMLLTDVRIGTAATATIAATALAAAEVWGLRTGRAQSVAVDGRAAIAAFRSERYLRVDDRPVSDPRGVLFGFYPTGDRRWVQIHANLPITTRATSSSSVAARRGSRWPPRSAGGRGRSSRMP